MRGSVDQPVVVLSRTEGREPATLALMRRIDELFLKYPFYGSRQMARQLQPGGRPRRPSPGAAADAADGPGRRSTRRPRTSAPHPAHRVYPYLLKGLAIERPNRVWCADITYIPVQRGFPVPGGDHGLGDAQVLGVAAVQIPWTPGFCVEALEEALARYGPPEIMTPTRDRSSPASAWITDAVLKDAGVASVHGRPGPLHGQHLHRAALAVAQIRGGLPARADRRLQGRAGHPGVDGVLQHRAAPLGLAGQTPAEAYGAGRPVDMMDKADALPTSPPAQQQQKDLINEILAA